MSSNSSDVTHSEQLTGVVKWFNAKSGFGFITVTDGDKSGSDIFVHHSGLNVENQNQYKYLVQGEYVEFVLSKSTDGNHEWQASNVSGIKGGKLMCETRHEFKVARNVYKNSKESVETFVPKQQVVPSDETQKDVSSDKKVRKPRSRGEGPRENDKDWSLVKTKSNVGTSRKQRVVTSSTV